MGPPVFGGLPPTSVAAAISHDAALYGAADPPAMPPFGCAVGLRSVLAIPLFTDDGSAVSEVLALHF